MSGFMLILGIIIVIAGIQCVATPVMTFTALSWLVGVYILVTGIASLLRYFSKKGKKSIWDLLGGISGAVLGAYLIGNHFAHFATSVFIAYFAAFWMILRGVNGIVKAFAIKKLNKKNPSDPKTKVWIVVLVLGILTILLGFVCAAHPFVTMMSVGWLIGLSIISSGAQTIMMALSAV